MRIYSVFGYVTIEVWFDFKKFFKIDNLHVIEQVAKKTTKY